MFCDRGRILFLGKVRDGNGVGSIFTALEVVSKESMIFQS
jgi:hypothetical protein